MIRRIEIVPRPTFGRKLEGESLEDSANLPDHDIIAAEIVEDLQAVLAQFAEIAADRKSKRGKLPL